MFTIKNFFFDFFLQPYSRTAVWHLGVRPPSGVAGHRVPWPAAKEFQWEPGLFSCRKKRQCWDVTGKWSKRKCARPLSASAKVCTSFRGCVYCWCRFRAAGMYWDVGTCPSPFIWQISLVLIQLGGILWPPHRLVPAKIFDLPAPLLCKPYYLICTYTKSKTNGVSCWL